MSDQNWKLKRAAERGAALAKAAMADPQFAEAAYSMSKEAGWGADLAKGMGGMALTATVGGLGIGLSNAAINAVNNAFSSLSQGRQKAKGFSDMMRVHKGLGQEDKHKVQAAFNTLHKFNPDAALDPLTAGSFVQKAVDYGGVTTEEVKNLVSTRKAMRDAQKNEGGFMPTMPGFGNMNIPGIELK